MRPFGASQLRVNRGSPESSSLSETYFVGAKLRALGDLEFGRGVLERPLLDLNAAKKAVGVSVEVLRPALFKLADLVLRSSKSSWPTCVIIDDASARFVGLFLARVLNSERATPTLTIRLIGRGEFESCPRKRRALHGWVKIHAPYLGDRPLIVTDTVDSGEHLAVFTGVLNSFNCVPDIAALLRSRSNIAHLLFYPLDLLSHFGAASLSGQIPLQEIFKRMLPDGTLIRNAAFDEVIGRGGKIRIGKIVVSHTIHTHSISRAFLRHFDDRGDLNAVVSNHSFSTWDPLYAPIAWAALAHDQSDRANRNKVVRFSRMLLKDLVTEYLRRNL